MRESLFSDHLLRQVPDIRGYKVELRKKIYRTVASLTRVILSMHFNLYWSIVHSAVVRYSWGSSPWFWYSSWRLLRSRVSQFLPNSRRDLAPESFFFHASQNSPRILLYAPSLFWFLPYSTFSPILKGRSGTCLQTPRKVMFPVHFYLSHRLCII